jgi:uncharacterized protein
VIYAFRLLDKPDTAALRQHLRPAHKAYLGAVAHRMAFAGPLTHDDGVTMIGSLLAIDFDSRDAAQVWLADEPFTRAGLYGNVEIHAFANLWPQRCRRRWPSGSLDANSSGGWRRRGLGVGLRHRVCTWCVSPGCGSPALDPAGFGGWARSVAATS